MKDKRPICPLCGVSKVEFGILKDGTRSFRGQCMQCRHKPYRKYKKKYCELCDFKPVHPCQLDIHHVDGDHKNNNKKNLKTLCANCHRLISCVH